VANGTSDRRQNTLERCIQRVRRIHIRELLPAWRRPRSSEGDIDGTLNAFDCDVAAAGLGAAAAGLGGAAGALVAQNPGFGRAIIQRGDVSFPGYEAVIARLEVGPGVTGEQEQTAPIPASAQP